MINAAVTPINSTLASLSKEVDGIQCKLPNTVTLPANTSVAVPTCLAAQYGYYGLPYSTGSLWG